MAGLEPVALNEPIDVSKGDEFRIAEKSEIEKFLGRPIKMDSVGRPILTVDELEKLGKDFEFDKSFSVSGKEQGNVKNPVDLHKALTDGLAFNQQLSIEERCALIDLIVSQAPSGRVYVTSGTWKLELTSREAIDDAVKLLKPIREVWATLEKLSPRAQRMVMRQIRHKYRQERKELQREKMHLQKETDGVNRRLDELKAAIVDLRAWYERPFELQTPPTTMFHKVMEDVQDGKAIIVDKYEATHPEVFTEAWGDASLFVVEHNWAAAFSGAGDYIGGEFRLPDDCCIFEFRIGGKHVIAIAFELEGSVWFYTVIQTTAGWLIQPYNYQYVDGKWKAEHRGTASGDYTLQVGMDDPARDLVGAQIRAISIALEAEVAKTEVVRAPHKLNHAREKRGHLPIYDYHVISLSRRSRAERLPHDPNAEPGTRKRLHFRRGHWRHFSNHRTWIKWMLVGDPDLGFVDKHYKL